MNIVVVGAGYVGLVTALGFSKKGHDVVCVDLDEEIVKSLNDGIPHFYESDLEELLADCLSSKKFRATTNLYEALSFSEIVFLAVGTPTSNGIIDLSYVDAVITSIGNYLKENDKYLSIVIKSTVIPGTTDGRVKKLLKEVSGKDLGCYGLGMNPEFLREGSAVDDFISPDRIIFGYEDVKTLELLQMTYQHWTCDKLAVNSRTAEMIKYVNNALLATQISFVNEMANLTYEIKNIKFDDVIAGVHLDRRWSSRFENGSIFQPEVFAYHVPGCGFGGSCFPKDVAAILSLGKSMGLQMNLLDSVLTVNKFQPGRVVYQLKSELPLIKDLKFLVLGLAFKDGTNDIRESTSIKIIDELTSLGAEVFCHDPIVEESEVAAHLKQVNFVIDWRKELLNSDVVIITTPWPEYLEIQKFDKKLDGKVVFDCRRLFKSDAFIKAKYRTIGNG
jgi:UDPglucose 6-dehydrogenase/GDP-mannose 6-dehydrogenase